MKKKGFTLVEVIVVISIIALVLPAVFSIVFTILKQQVQVYKLTEVKRQGDYSLSTLQNILRPVYGVYKDMSTEVCINSSFPSSTFSDGRTMLFKNKDGSYLQIYVENERLILNSNGVIGPLTSSKVAVSDLQLTCRRTSAYTPSILEVAYKVQYGTLTSSEDSPSLNYRTRIILRNN